MGHPTWPDGGCSYFANGSIILMRRQKAAPSEEIFPMVHDLVLALIFLAMIIAPALLAMRSEKEEKDAL